VCHGESNIFTDSWVGWGEGGQKFHCALNIFLAKGIATGCNCHLPSRHQKKLADLWQYPTLAKSQNCQNCHLSHLHQSDARNGSQKKYFKNFFGQGIATRCGHHPAAKGNGGSMAIHTLVKSKNNTPTTHTKVMQKMDMQLPTKKLSYKVQCLL